MVLDRTGSQFCTVQGATTSLGFLSLVQNRMAVVFKFGFNYPENCDNFFSGIFMLILGFWRVSNDEKIDCYFVLF